MPTGLPRLLPRVGIDILDRAHDERADGDAGGLGALFQPLVQRFRELDNGSGWHELIMTQVKIEGASEQVSIANAPFLKNRCVLASHFAKTGKL